MAKVKVLIGSIGFSSDTSSPEKALETWKVCERGEVADIPGSVLKGLRAAPLIPADYELLEGKPEPAKAKIP